MSNSRISYLNISPYSRQSPSQLKTELKKNSSSVERPKSSKAAYAASSRGNTPINNPEAIDRKYSPFVDRKDELMASLYNIPKTKTREKASTPKPSTSKQRDNSSSSKKLIKNSNRPIDKINEKLQIYQYLQNKSFKKDEGKSFNQPLSYTPSRSGSRNYIDEKESNNERRILEASILQQKQLIEALEEMHRSRNKASAYSNNRDNLANLLKSAQRPPTSTPAKAHYSNVSASMGSVGKSTDERRKGSDSKRGDIFKDLRINMNQSDIIQPQQKQKMTPQTSQKENNPRAKHRRGLSSGQNPLYVDQQMALEQQMAMEQHLALEQMAREQERQERQERERQKQLQLQLQMQQQMELQQQMQMQQQQQQYARDPQQEEDEYYERFFHMDRMTFDFERLVIAQKLSRQQNPTTTNPQEEENKQGTTRGSTAAGSHARTRSIEDPNALMPTKSSSRWTTKRSSVGEEPQLEQKSMGNFISDVDRTDVDKEEMRRYYKH